MNEKWPAPSVTRTSTETESDIALAIHSVWIGGVMLSAEPTHVRTGTRTASSAAGARKNPVGGSQES